MSRKFNSKEKALVNLKLVDSSEVWHRREDGSYVYDKKFKVFGKVEKGTSAFITNTNLKGKNPKYVDDTCNLPKKIKNEIVKKFADDNKKVVYLVKI